MLKTWTDTHYQLDSQDWLYIAKHGDRPCPGVSRLCPGWLRV